MKFRLDIAGIISFRSMKREEISTFLLAYGRRLYQLWVPPDAVTESLVIALGVRLEQAR
jgi:hypothetical protein